ncbi:extracellular protein, lysine-rich [Lactiplantibacillus plantarum]|nr:extracellular protein, lysine-rich [Lactiplantibacillus plantarum]
MQNVITLGDGTKVNVHFVYNKITGKFDDFKFK